MRIPEITGASEVRLSLLDNEYKVNFPVAQDNIPWPARCPSFRQGGLPVPGNCHATMDPNCLSLR